MNNERIEVEDNLPTKNIINNYEWFLVGHGFQLLL